MGPEDIQGHDSSCLRFEGGLHSQDCLALGAIFAATDTVAVLQVRTERAASLQHPQQAV